MIRKKEERRILLLIFAAIVIVEMAWYIGGEILCQSITTENQSEEILRVNPVQSLFCRLAGIKDTSIEQTQ
ncbi:hypothetical protein [Christiangramia fulva]|uniref:hypothetical protein n=1 Tax=Christiangramia fulva TaxID=2126553 RepID=UPI00131B1FC7|nr:hypothetical protein [Christiangramia fulva]